MKYLVLLLALMLVGCTLHVCGNSEVAHQVGEGSIGEVQEQKDSAELEAEVPVK